MIGTGIKALRKLEHKKWPFASLAKDYYRCLSKKKKSSSKKQEAEEKEEEEEGANDDNQEEAESKVDEAIDMTDVKKKEEKKLLDMNKHL